MCRSGYMISMPKPRMTAKAEKIRTERHGDTEYTYTDHFHVYRDVEAQFEKVPADASEKWTMTRWIS